MPFIWYSGHYKMMKYDIEQYMKEEGWIFECYSPLEIRNGESFATNLAARIVMEYYQKELEISEGDWDTD